MKVNEIMSREVATIDPKASLLDALRVMTTRKVSGLPVVNANGEVVGMITEGDLLRRTELNSERESTSWWSDVLFHPLRSATDFIISHGSIVEEIMTKEPRVIGDETDLKDAVESMQKYAIKRLPVIGMSGLVGILSRSDLVRALREKLEQSGVDRALFAGSSDDDIVKAIEAALSDKPWFNRGNVSFECKNGQVLISGAVTDENTATAIRVVVENTLGVKVVKDDLAVIEPLSGTALPRY